MDSVDLLEDAPPAPPKRRRWMLSPALIISVVLHLIFAGGATYYVVSRYTGSRKLTFQGGPKSPNPSERSLQHRVQVEKRMQTQSQPAAVPKRVLTTGLAKVALPPMPEIAAPKTGAATMAGAAAPAAGFSSSAPMGGGAIGGTGSGSPVSFFGIRDVSTSVVIMIDVSDSMFGRTGDYDYKSRKLVRIGKEQSFQRVRDEAIKLIQALTPATRFGIVRWSGAAYSWKPELVGATEDNKQAAIAHIQNDIDVHKAPKRPDRPGGTRHDYALEEAFKLKPETIYMLTDGDANGDSPTQPGKKISAEDLYRVAEEGQKTLPKKAKLHTIYYVTAADKPEEEKMLRQLANRNGGSLIKVTAPSGGQSTGLAATGSATPAQSPKPPARKDKKSRKPSRSGD